MNPKGLSGSRVCLLSPITAALAAAGLISTAQAQVQVAGTLLINVDATAAPLGPITSIANAGSLGGFFEARGGGANNPAVAQVSGNGTRGIHFDGSDYMQHVATVGGALVPADATLVGANPTCSIEAWVLNPDVSGEETIVSWGQRGGPDGSNMSFNYGWDDRWGAVGHWGAADIGWDPCCNSGTDPQGVPKSGLWHHLVYTYNGTTTRVYADGVLRNSESIGLNTTSGTAVMIGSQYEPDGVTPTGPLRASMTIARLRIHSEALSDAQVANNYNFERNNFTEGGSPLPFGPIHRYSFLNPVGPAPSGSVISDSVGSANGVVRGTGANFTGNRLTIPGGASLSAAYVDLPNRLLSVNSADGGGSGQITLEGWVKITAGRSWGRIFDFGNGTAGEITGPGGSAEGRDYVFFSGSNGTNPNRHEYGLRNLIPPTGSDVGAGYDTANFNRDFHFAFTWNEATGQILIYENGELALTTSVNSALDRFSTIDDVNVWLGRSNWTGDENAQGEYDEFRIYNRVLPADQVRASYTAGPDQLATADPVSFVAQPQSQSIPELGNVTFIALAQGALPISLQWYKNSSPLTAQTNNSLTLTSVPLSDSNAQFYVIGSNNISGSSFTATSSVAVLTVIPDTIPPTLTQIRVNGRSTLELFLSEPIQPADAANPGNFILSGPPGAPIVLTSAAGSDGRRVLLTLNGPLECTAYTLTVNGVHDLSAAGNVIATDSTIVFWNYAPASLKHRYTFNNSAAADATGATVEDAIGTGDGTVRSGGRPTSFTGDRVTLSGGPSGTSPYVDLANNLLSANSINNGGTGQLSFEGWVKVTGNHSWSRIIDMGSSGPCCAPGSEVFGPGGGGEGIDYFFYSAQIGTDVNRRRVDITNRDTGGAAGVEYAVGNFNQDLHFVITWDEQTQQVNTYENGLLVGTFTSQNQMSDINDVNVWLGRSNWSADENLQGEFDEFRVHNQILSPATVALDRLGGPDNNFGAPVSLSLVVSNHVMITNTVQRALALVNFSNVGTQEVAASGCATFESSDSGVVSVSANGVLEALANGSSTITVRFAGQEDSQLVEVTTDVTGPHLVRARPFGANIIELLFSEPVVFADATDQGNYEVSGPGGSLSVGTVTLSSNPAQVFIGLTDPLRCEYTTVTVRDVHDLSPNNNVLDPNPSSISFMNYVPRGLQHRYTFNNGTTGNAPSGTAVPDAVGSADGVVLGGPASFTGEKLVLDGGSSTTAGYVDLPNGLLSVNGVANGGSGEISVEGWVKITGVHTWSRIFDFGSSLDSEVTGPGGGGEGRDYFMLSAENGNDPTVRRIEVRNEDPPGGGIYTVDQATAGFNQDTHFVVTWNENTGQIRAYENGAQVAGMNLPTKMSDIHDVNVWLGRSNWTGDENTQGEFDEFRIYNRVLSLAEVQASEAIGPDNSLGEPKAIRISLPSLVQLGQTITPTVVADFSSVSNVDLSGTACFTLQSSDLGVISVGNNGVIGAVGGGTATVTARISGFSDSAPTTVNLQPLAGDDEFTTPQNVPKTVDYTTLLSNDSDPDGNTPLTITAVSSLSTNGATVTHDATSLTYTPVNNYSGPDLITYTVSDTRGGIALGRVLVRVNDCPTAFGTNLTVNSGALVTFRLRASDPEGDTLQYIVTQPPLHGTLTVHIQTGAASYTPAPGYSGPDAFRFKVNDGGCDSAEALVNITVINPNHCPTASPSVVSVTSGATANFQLQASDPDGDALQYIVTQPPAHGTLTVNTATGASSYTPSSSYTGPDSVRFKVNDGQCDSAEATVSITVSNPNHPPTARIVAAPLADFSPYLPNKVLIAANGSNACLVLDGSMSSDPESPVSDLSFLWFQQPSPLPFASGVLVSNCVELDTYTFLLTVTDPQGATGTDTLTIDVLTPCEAEGALILIIENSALPRSVKRPLVSSVKAACASYEKDGVNAGVNQLQAFQNKVRTHVRPLDLALAKQLNDAAQVIIDALNGL